MKNSILRFLVSKAGGILTPLIATAVAAVVAKLALMDPTLAESLNQAEITAFVVAFIMSAVNYFTNRAQTEGVKAIQAMVNVDQDGIPGPVTYSEVRRAIPVSAPQKSRKRK